MSWSVYILRCADDTLYTGITNNFDARLLKHETGLGAKYTKGRGPFTPIYKESFENRSEASKRETAIKKLSREEKLILAANYIETP